MLFFRFRSICISGIILIMHPHSNLVCICGCSFLAYTLALLPTTANLCIRTPVLCASADALFPHQLYIFFQLQPNCTSASLSFSNCGCIIYAPVHPCLSNPGKSCIRILIIWIFADAFSLISTRSYRMLTRKDK